MSFIFFLLIVFITCIVQTAFNMHYNRAVKPSSLASVLIDQLEQGEPVAGHIREELNDPIELNLSGRVVVLHSHIVEFSAEDGEGWAAVTSRPKPKKQLDNNCLLLELD
jgi:hypothetical protein